MPQKSKVLERLERLINQISQVEKTEWPYPGKYDLWKRRVELFLRRVCSSEIVEEFNSITKEERLPPSGTWLFSGKTFEQRLQQRREKELIYYRAALYRAKNLLNAVKEDIELFELDEEAKKEAKKIKRKYEIEGGIPGLLKGKFSKEVEDK
jgi:uncharacterized protein YbaR (Trm112 family)